MKKHLLSFVFLGTVFFQGFSQTTKLTLPASDTKEYEKMKAEGKIPANFSFENKNTTFQPSFEDLQRLGTSHKMPSSGCGCYITPDASEIEKLSSKFSFISNSIDEKTMRWLELQD